MYACSPPFVLNKRHIKSCQVDEICKVVEEKGEVAKERGVGPDKKAKTIFAEPPLLGDFYSRLINDVFFINREYYGFDLYDNQLSTPQFTIYDSDQFARYGPHRDMIPSPFYDIKLTAIINVSQEPYVGGNFKIHERLEQQKEEIKFDSQDLIVFPSFYMHEVTPLVTGVRKSLTIFFDGPPFR